MARCQLRRTSYWLIATAVSIATVAIGTEESPAPENCHWQPIPELKAKLAIPNGWIFEKVASDESLVYEVTPVGPGIQDPSKSKYRLVVRRAVDRELVVKSAREFVESVRLAGAPTDALEEQRNGVVTMFASVVEFWDTEAGVPERTVAASALANARTGTLYTVRFDIVAEELASVAPLGNHLFRMITIDDEV